MDLTVLSLAFRDTAAAPGPLQGPGQGSGAANGCRASNCFIFLSSGLSGQAARTLDTPLIDLRLHTILLDFGVLHDVSSSLRAHIRSALHVRCTPRAAWAEQNISSFPG